VVKLGRIQPLFDQERIPLWKEIPLSAPLSVNIEPSGICNFKCKYCAQSLGEEFDTRHFKRELMSIEVFEKTVQQLKAFKKKIKKIHLFRNGEPLCNPNLCYMVNRITEENICEAINITTNGSLLTEEYSIGLINAGLTSLSVSLQGLSKEKYIDVCGTKVDFEKLYQNLKFFYDHRSNCKLYIKIIDIALESESEKGRFFELFTPISDRVYIETAVPVYESVDYSHILRENKSVTRSGFDVKEPLVCQLAFYHLHILANGDVLPCNSIEFPIRNWNVNSSDLFSIWNSEERKKFLELQLQGRRKSNQICRFCERLSQEFQPQDSLDEYRERILKNLDC